MPYDKDFLIDRLLYRDGLILVIDKPAGLAVHAKPGAAYGQEQQDNLEHYFDALRFGLPRLPVLAHRLDRDTSGCLVLARHPKAARKMGKLFQEGKVRKTYWAICKGVPAAPSGTIDLPIYKHTDKQGWSMRTGDQDGAHNINGHKIETKRAVTTYRMLKQADGMSLIECRPKTGRTHQIRVHLNAIGIPIIGDPRYGELSTEERNHPMMLHARALSIPLSSTKPAIEVTAQTPETMEDLLQCFGENLL